MSSTLFWEPVRPADKTLSSGLKLLLREVYGFPVNLNFTPHQINELTALKAGRDADMQKEIGQLIEAIERHDIIHVFEGDW